MNIAKFLEPQIGFFSRNLVLIIFPIGSKEYYFCYIFVAAVGITLEKYPPIKNADGMGLIMFLIPTKKQKQKTEIKTNKKQTNTINSKFSK